MGPKVQDSPRFFSVGQETQTARGQREAECTANGQAGPASDGPRLCCVFPTRVWLAVCLRPRCGLGLGIQANIRRVTEIEMGAVSSVGNGVVQGEQSRSSG